MSRILIVDDEVGEIDALCQILMPKYEVRVAKSGATAIDRAVKHNPDLILLDVIMPDMSGFEVIRALKSDDATRRIPVIFITGLDKTESEAKGLLLGAVDYITKPFNELIVKARVRTHLQIVEYINTIENMCRVDALTNLANRRHLDDQLAVEWERAARQQTWLGFIMIDIDYFKQYNDTYGHMQGDALLRAVASVFTDSLHRPADMAARWGGEEFAVILPESDWPGVLEVAERIRRNVENTVIPCADGRETQVTVSLGVVAAVPGAEGLESFFQKADQALYKAKQSGRNRVQAADYTNHQEV